MNNNEIVVWGIHNTNNESLLLHESVIAIGWNKMGDLSKIKSDRESYYEIYNKVYADK